jgi:hypothetical protein
VVVKVGFDERGGESILNSRGGEGGDAVDGLEAGSADRAGGAVTEEEREEASVQNRSKLIEPSHKHHTTNTHQSSFCAVDSSSLSHPRCKPRD